MAVLCSPQGLRLHVAGEGYRSIRYLRCVARHFLVVGVHRFDFPVVVVAGGPDGVLTTILDLAVFSSLSRDGSLERLYVVSLSVAPGMLLVDH